jgi:hypothetical protein
MPAVPCQRQAAPPGQRFRVVHQVGFLRRYSGASQRERQPPRFRRAAGSAGRSGLRHQCWRLISWRRLIANPDYPMSTAVQTPKDDPDRERHADDQARASVCPVDSSPMSTAACARTPTFSGVAARWRESRRAVYLAPKAKRIMGPKLLAAMGPTK